MNLKINCFSDRVVQHLCVLLRTQRAAAADGNQEMVNVYGAKIDGFLDALSITLAGPYLAALVDQANLKADEAKEA